MVMVKVSAEPRVCVTSRDVAKVVCNVRFKVIVMWKYGDRVIGQVRFKAAIMS